MLETVSTTFSGSWSHQATFNVQLQTKVTLSPNGAHQVMWHRFVNSRGGMGNNIPCDVYNEHINRLVKYIIQNMGSNLTEKSLQRAARSVSTLHSICQVFDVQSGVPHGTVAHSTRSDTQDIVKVVNTVIQNQLLVPVPGRKHSVFQNFILTHYTNGTDKDLDTEEKDRVYQVSQIQQ